MSEPKILIKYDYNNQQIKVEPREEVSDQELLELGMGLFQILKRYDPTELDQLNTKLNKLDQVLRDVQSVIRFLQYTGGDCNQKVNHTHSNTDLNTERNGSS